MAAWCNISIDYHSNPLYYAHHLYLNGKEVIELNIPTSVTSIGDGAFYGCTGLTSVTIPNSVTSIGNSAFYGCTGLTSVTIPNSVNSIGSYAFWGCTGLTNINIPNSVTSIGWYTFSGTPWYDNLPGGLIYIGLVAYKYKGEMPENTSIVIKEGTKSIGNGTFEACSGLTSVTFPNSVSSIGRSAFRGCTGLTSVTIPNSITSIGSSAFERCTGLTNIYALRTEPKDYHANGFDDTYFDKDTYKKARLHVPIGCRNAYSTTDPWSMFENIIDDIELTGIEDVIADSNTEAHKQITDYYNLQGQRTTRLQRGVNIICYSDGTTKKVLVK